MPQIRRVDTARWTLHNWNICLSSLRDRTNTGTAHGTLLLAAPCCCVYLQFKQSAILSKHTHTQKTPLHYITDVPLPASHPVLLWQPPPRQRQHAVSGHTQRCSRSEQRGCFAVCRGTAARSIRGSLSLFTAIRCPSSTPLACLAACRRIFSQSMKKCHSEMRACVKRWKRWIAHFFLPFIFNADQSPRSHSSTPPTFFLFFF